MATFDLTNEYYRAPGGYTGLNTYQGFTYKKFLGSELKRLAKGETPANGDTYKIFKLPKFGIVKEVLVLVLKAATTAITLSVGYTDGTNTDADAFETDAALNAAGVTYSSVDQLFMVKNENFLTITPSAITTLNDDAEFLVGAKIDSLNNLNPNTTPSAPV